MNQITVLYEQLQSIEQIQITIYFDVNKNICYFAPQVNLKRAICLLYSI